MLFSDLRLIASSTSLTGFATGSGTGRGARPSARPRPRVRARRHPSVPPRRCIPGAAGAGEGSFTARLTALRDRRWSLRLHVAGIPTGFENGPPEVRWKKTLHQALAPHRPRGDERARRLRFTPPPVAPGRPGADLDNLIDPLLAVLSAS